MPSIVKKCPTFATRVSIEGARHKRLEMFCAPLLLEVGNAGTHLVRAQRQAGCPEGPLKNYLISKYLA